MINIKPHKTVELFTYTKAIINGKLHFFGVKVNLSCKQGEMELSNINEIEPKPGNY